MPRYVLTSIFWVVSLLSGCVSTGNRENYVEQATHLSQTVSVRTDEYEAGSAAHLTDLIDSQELRSLVYEALENNPGFQQTFLALQQSRLRLRQSQSERYPELAAGFDMSRAEDTDTQYTGSMTLSWQLDVWQQIEDGINAEEQNLFQQQAIYRAARDTLASEVMNSWLSLLALTRTLAIEQRRLSTLELNEQLILERYQRGLSSLDDLDSARSSTFSTRASVREQEQSIQQDERALNSLLGRLEENQYEVPDQYPVVSRAQMDLPEQTLARRFDLQAAWHAIAAAESDARVAYKDLLPRIDIQLALQDVAASPADALLTDPVWTLLGQLTAPLFQGGRLRAAAEIANLETASRYQSYRETLLTAVEEVGNALTREKALAARHSYIQQALEKQQLAFNRYQDKYRAGNATILELLTVQQQTYDLEAQLETLTYNRLSNRITLALALGLGVSE
ncbi:TolC family protein [Halopseudomonas pelagia]|uniref:TolC family protein n=1 Tax=Halopseudomonas pelagia TaxID=553151 RepID=UPI00039A57F6|nr:TolC family protein [Halopseudomonas pelagia]